MARYDGEPHADQLSARSDRVGGMSTCRDGLWSFVALIPTVRPESACRRVCRRAVLDRHKAAGIILSYDGRQRGWGCSVICKVCVFGWGV